jgi:hypothetical protein
VNKRFPLFRNIFKCNMRKEIGHIGEIITRCSRRSGTRRRTIGRRRRRNESRRIRIGRHRIDQTVSEWDNRRKNM